MAPLAVVLLSGGLDSLVCTSLLREQGWEITALFVDYGQKALAAELAAAKELALQQNFNLETARIQARDIFGQGLIVGRNTALVAVALRAVPESLNLI